LADGGWGAALAEEGASTRGAKQIPAASISPAKHSPACRATPIERCSSAIPANPFGGKRSAVRAGIAFATLNVTPDQPAALRESGRARQFRRFISFRKPSTFHEL
jgi:hypothetical protein